MAGATWLDFPTYLSDRGSTFRVYANSGYQPHPSDTTLFRLMMEVLMVDGAGVTSVEVENRLLMRVYHGKAVTSEDILARVMGAVRRAGKTPVLVK